LALLIHVLIHGTLVMTMGNWLPPFGIAFVADALSASFALTSSIAALACGIYACRDVDAGQRRFGFFPLLIIMLAGVNGAFLTGDIFNLYVWFEVLLIASFGLIVLGNRREQLDGALKYAILNFLATTLFLIATGYLYGIIGTLNMADIALRMPSLAGTAPVTTIAILFLVAFAMKAAAFPLNFWLPASYHTPNIVVGAVFAGLLTKVGVYALIRTFTLLFPSEVAPVHGLLLIIGALTMLVGAFGALAQSDLRRVLGYLVVSGIGYMLVGLGLNSAEGLRGGVFYAMHSIITMTLVYLLAGIIIKRSGSFQLDKIGGFYAQSPLLAGLFFIAMLAVSGLPPFSGFWPKLMLVQAGLQSGQGLVVFAIVLAGFVTTLCMGRLWIFMFLRNGAVSAPETELAKLKSLGKEAALAYVLPVLLLTSFVTAFGLWPAPLLDVVSAGVDGLINPAAYIETVLGVK
jgi:multicomponent Na+:H+ antiporter subunit D